MITKFVLIVWIGGAQTQTLSIQTIDTQSECDAIASVLADEINRKGWYRCVPYTFSNKEDF